METSPRLEQLFTLKKQMSNDPFIEFAIAKEYEKLGNTTKALEIYHNLVQNHKDYVGTYYHLGKLLEKDNQLEKALTIYEEGIAVATQLKEHHALGELKEAHMNLEDLMW